jgi:hypothetical protein
MDIETLSWSLQVDLKDKWRTRSKHHLDFQDHPSDQE